MTDTITLPRSVVEQALEALNASMPHNNDMAEDWPSHIAARRALRAALERPQGKQEPICWVTGYYGGRCTVAPRNGATVLPVGMALYTHPHTPRQPLTDEEIYKIGLEHKRIAKDGTEWFDRESFARAIERAHGIGGEA